MSVPAFGLRLKSLRTAAGLTQVELAERAGITQQAIGHYEVGTRDPGWKVACALADALGVSTEAFRELPAARTKKPRQRASATEKPA